MRSKLEAMERYGFAHSLPFSLEGLFEMIKPVNSEE
jgi:hypothetical protein